LRQARLKLAALTEAIKSPSASVVALVVECGIASWLTGTAEIAAVVAPAMPAREA
jgi:hypothetical protein